MKAKVNLEAQLKLADEKIAKLDVRPPVTHTVETQTDMKEEDVSRNMNGKVNNKKVHMRSMEVQTENMTIAMEEGKTSDPRNVDNNSKILEVNELKKEIKKLKKQLTDKHNTERKLYAQLSEYRSNNKSQKQIKEIQQNDLEKYENHLEKWSDDDFTESIDNNEDDEKPAGHLLGVLMRKVNDVDEQKFSIKVSTAVQTETIQVLPSNKHHNESLYAPPPAQPESNVSAASVNQSLEILQLSEENKSNGTTTVRELMADQMARNLARSRNVNSLA